MVIVNVAGQVVPYKRIRGVSSSVFRVVKVVNGRGTGEWYNSHGLQRKFNTRMNLVGVGHLNQGEYEVGEHVKVTTEENASFLTRTGT